MHPTPLFFQVPRDILKRQMQEASYAIGPDFLCFETFYQSVALTWPENMKVIDVGGSFGVQGWLFSDFKRYVCVDCYDMITTIDGFRVPRRCTLPDSGIHVVSEGFDYVSRFIESNANTSDVLFLCSAVPNEKLRDFVLGMPNSIVWYPGKPMRGNGAHVASTIVEYERLRREKWHDEADKVVWNAIDNDPFWK